MIYAIGTCPSLPLKQRHSNVNDINSSYFQENYYNSLEPVSVLERSCKEGHGFVEGLKDIQHEVVPLAVECTVCRKGGFRKTRKTAKILQCDHWFPHELTSKNER